MLARLFQTLLLALILEKTIGKTVEIPADLAVLKDKEKVAKKMGTDFEEFKEYLMEVAKENVTI